MSYAIIITIAIDMVLLVGDWISSKNMIANTIVNWNSKVSHDTILNYWSQFGYVEWVGIQIDPQKCTINKCVNTKIGIEIARTNNQ